MKILRIVLPALLISLGVFLVIRFGSKKTGAIEINAIPGAKVFINGDLVGEAPYKDDAVVSGDLDLRLEPQGVDGAIAWERRLTITPNTRVVIRKQFAVFSDDEFSQILYWERTGDKKKAGLVLTSIPNGVAVSVDGQMRGFAPLNLDDIGSGEHKLLLTHPDYKSEEIIVKTLSDYRLVVEAKLAASGEVSEIQQEQEEEMIVVPKIVINETPTGWLRVRDKASTVGKEVGRVDPDDEYEILDEDNGWYKIEYEQGEEGWISGQYATKTELP
ncbi:MAG: SH3 domain-containing protein [Candidatus Shapirobacteria bacterium]